MSAFRLQTVLDLKHRLEDAQQQELANLAQQRMQAEEALRLLAQQQRTQEEALAERVRNGQLRADEVNATIAYIENVRASITAQRDYTSALEQRIRESRERLTELARERQVLEKLRERHLEEVAVEDNRRDQRAADELVSQRYARKAWEV